MRELISYSLSGRKGLINYLINFVVITVAAFILDMIAVGVIIIDGSVTSIEYVGFLAVMPVCCGIMFYAYMRSTFRFGVNCGSSRSSFAVTAFLAAFIYSLVCSVIIELFDTIFYAIANQSEVLIFPERFDEFNITELFALPVRAMSLELYFLACMTASGAALLYLGLRYRFNGKAGLFIMAFIVMVMWYMADSRSDTYLFSLLDAVDNRISLSLPATYYGFRDSNIRRGYPYVYGGVFANLIQLFLGAYCIFYFLIRRVPCRGD